MKHFTTFLYLCLVFATATKAQEAMLDSIFDMSLEALMQIEIDVSSTQSATLFNTPSTVTVVDKDLLRRYNFMDVAEAVRLVSGIDIYQTNLDVNVATSRGVLQNYYANKVLILINNIPTWQPIYGNGTLDRIDINDVERIEILKGPASVLYGTNAFTGVINIVLRNQNEQGVTAHAQYGFKDIGSGGANLNLKTESWKLFVSANSSYENRTVRTQQNNATQPHADPNDSYQYTEQLRKNNANLSATHRGFTLFANTYSSTYTFPGINISYDSGGGTDMADQGLLTGLRFDRNFGEHIKLNTHLVRDYFDRNYPTNPDRSTELYLKAQRSQASAKVNIAITNHLSVEVGTEAEVGSGEHQLRNTKTGEVIQSNTKKNDGLQNISAFMQVNAHWDKLSVLVGGRYVNNNLFGSNFSYRATGVYAFNKTNSLKLIAGQAYRVPSILELYFDHPTVIGNPTLKPELSNSFELAYLHQAGKFFVQALGYYSQYSELIQRITPVAWAPSEYYNLGAFDSYGFEAELKYQDTEKLMAFLNYNYMAGIGNESKSNFDLVPQHTFSVGITLPIHNFSVGSNAFIHSQVKGPLAKISAQHFMDMHLAYRHKYKGISIQHTLSGKNITQSDMLTPQYIRSSTNINALPTMAYGTRVLYTLRVYL